MTRSDPQQLVEDHITSALRGLERESALDDVCNVMKKISTDQPLDYGSEWLHFAMAYFITNYRKCLEVLRLFPRIPAMSVLDVGCGTGAASLAFLTVAKERGLAPHRVVLLDQAEQPLEMAALMIAKVSWELGMVTEVTTLCTDICDYTSPAPEDVVLCSHVLSEHTIEEASGIWTHIVRNLPADGLAVAIERASDEPWSHFDLTDVDPLVESNSGSLAVRAPAPSLGGIQRDWQTSWALTRTPTDWVRELILLYFRAWETQDLRILDQIFTEAAIYSDKPFSVTMVGLEAIRHYWDSKVLPQDINFARPLSIWYGILSATMNWEADTSIDHQRRLLKGMMHLSFDPAEKKIKELTEVYRAQKEKSR